jgi:hypothetical protein
MYINKIYFTRCHDAGFAVTYFTPSICNSVHPCMVSVVEGFDTSYIYLCLSIFLLFFSLCISFFVFLHCLFRPIWPSRSPMRLVFSRNINLYAILAERGGFPLCYVCCFVFFCLLACFLRFGHVCFFMRLNLST